MTTVGTGHTVIRTTRDRLRHYAWIDHNVYGTEHRYVLRSWCDATGDQIYREARTDTVTCFACIAKGPPT